MEYMMVGVLRPSPEISRELPEGTTYSVLEHSNNTAYFYDFSIPEDLRGTGASRTIFQSIKARLYDEGYRYIKLQVSSSNPKAFHLYRNSGLRVSESVLVKKIPGDGSVVYL